MHPPSVRCLSRKTATPPKRHQLRSPPHTHIHVVTCEESVYVSAQYFQVHHRIQHVCTASTLKRFVLLMNERGIHPFDHLQKALQDCPPKLNFVILASRKECMPDLRVSDASYNNIEVAVFVWNVFWTLTGIYPQPLQPKTAGNL